MRRRARRSGSRSSRAAHGSRSRRSRTSRPVLVRAATPDDARAIAFVRTRTWQAAYAHVFPHEELSGLEVDANADWWRTVIEAPRPNTHTLVACAEDEVVGFASLGAAREEDDRLGELYAIYVLPEAAGSGIGRALMAETLSLLREEGFDEAVLWVLEDNPRTRRFYELAGWAADGGTKEEEWLGTSIREIRYRIALAPTP